MIEARANGLASDYEFMLGCNNEGLLPFVYPESEIESALNMNRVQVDLIDGETTEDEESRIFGKKEETDGQVEMAEDESLRKSLGGEKGNKKISQHHQEAIPDKATLDPSDDSKNDHEIVDRQDEKPIDKQRKKFAAQETNGRILKPVKPRKQEKPDVTGTIKGGRPLHSKFFKSGEERQHPEARNAPYKKEGIISKFVRKHMGIK